MARRITGLLLAWLLSAGAWAEPASELTVWINQRDRGLEAALSEFERRNPSVSIRVSMYLRGQDSQKLMTAIAGGDPPDVVIQDRFTVGEWASRGAFLPLDELIASSLERASAGGPQGIDRATFYESAWAEAEFEGRTYAVPLSTDARALYYNEDALRRAGRVDATGAVIPPGNWEELREYTRQLTRSDASGRLTQLGFAPNYGNSWLYLYGWLNGGEFMSADRRRVTLNEPRVVEALAYMVDLYDAAGGAEQVDAFVSSASGMEFNPFLQGDLAMMVHGNIFLNWIAAYQPDLPFGVAPPPAPQGKPSVTWSGGFSYVIPRNTSQAREAFELIRFLVSDEGWSVQHEVNARYNRGRGAAYVPNLTAQPAVNQRLYERYILSDPNMPPRIASAFPVFFELLTTSKHRPVTPVGQLLWDEHVRAIASAARGGVPAQTALDRATQNTQRQLDRILTPPTGPEVGGWTISAGIGGLIALLLAGGAAWLMRATRRAPSARDEARAAPGFLGPWLAGFLVLTLGPVLASLVYSFTAYDVLHPARWVGLGNYTRILGDDPLFWLSLANTAYMLLGVPLGLAVGLAIAMLLNTQVRGMKAYRTVFFLPSIVPMVAASILWVWVLNPHNGLINSMLRMLGVDHPPLWLASPSWLLGSKAGIILMGLWSAGGSMVIWLAGLKGIPAHLYEAARIDGAGPIRQFWNVTIPMLTPYIFFNLVIGVIGTMQIFTQAYVMTQGGPADSTLFFAYYIFDNAFRYFQMGYASALAWVLLLLVFGLTLVQLWSAKRWVHYDMV